MIIKLTDSDLSKIKANFHTHTVYCDGKYTAALMAQAAYKKGFTHLGFSAHSMFPFAGKWHIPLEKIAEYKEEIYRLKEEYKDRMEIAFGFEADWFPPVTAPQKELYAEWAPDFIIGSVHYIATDKGHCSVDHRADRVKRGLDIVFGGDGKAFVKAYFAAERKMLETGGFDILGHADLVRKRNGELHFFDENEDWYRDELILTADAIAKAGVIVEVNTGGIYRGAIDDVYPSADFLTLLKERNVPVCINSDAHTTDGIDAAFDRAIEAVKNAGYTELTYPDIK